jgi:hypothetical protein
MGWQLDRGEDDVTDKPQPSSNPFSKKDEGMLEDQKQDIQKIEPGMVVEGD